MSKMKKFRLTTFASLSVVAISLTACGGGSSDSVGSAGGSVVVGQNGAVDVSSQGTFAQQMLGAVNAVRATTRHCGAEAMPAVPAVTWNALLTQSATGHAQDMANNNYASHTSLDGRTYFDRISATGYQSSFTSEVIGGGQTSVSQVVNGWVNSPGHCVVLMSPYAKEIGGGHAVKKGTKYVNYWALNVGSP